MQEKRKLIITILILLLVVSGLLLSISVQSITGAAVHDHYSYTKAICDQTNYCQDYEIVCEGSKVVSVSPLSGAAQFPQDWQDPRDEETRNKLC